MLSGKPATPTRNSGIVFPPAVEAAAEAAVEGAAAEDAAAEDAAAADDGAALAVVPPPVAADGAADGRLACVAVAGTAVAVAFAPHAASNADSAPLPTTSTPPRNNARRLTIRRFLVSTIPP